MVSRFLKHISFLSRNLDSSARQCPLCVSVGHDTECATVRRVGVPLALAALPRGLHRIPAHAAAALLVPGWRGRNTSDCR